MTHLTRAMGRPISKAQQEQAEGRKSRQAVLDAILELLTSEAIPSDTVRESAMALVYFEPKMLAEIDRIGRSYDSPKEREVRIALLLGIALRALNRLIA
jgi:hypothetical protein